MAVAAIDSRFSMRRPLLFRLQAREEITTVNRNKKYLANVD